MFEWKELKNQMPCGKSIVSQLDKIEYRDSNWLIIVEKYLFIGD